MSLPDYLLVILFPALLFASAFFSCSETALFSLSRHQRLKLSRSNQFADQAAVTLLSETRSLLITLLLGNMSVNTLYFVVSTLQLIRLQRAEVPGYVVTAVSVLPLVIIILLGEVLPKMLASRLTLPLVRLNAIPLLTIHRAIAPLRVFLSFAVITPLARLISPPTEVKSLEADELEAMLEMSKSQGVIDHEEEDMLQGVLELSQLKVRDLMKPRVDMVAFDIDEAPAQLIEQVLAQPFSRLPVYRGDIDHIEGVVYARQVLLRRPKSAKALAQIIRGVHYVPEQQRADRLLAEMRKTGQTFAVVVDEYGGTSGMITLKDLVEHMVGAIREPGAGSVASRVEALGDGRWRVDAELGIHEWVDRLGLRDPALRAARDMGVSTVGGLVMARLGRLPRVGDSTAIAGMVLEVERMDHRRINSLIVRPSQKGAGHE